MGVEIDDILKIRKVKLDFSNLKKSADILFKNSTKDSLAFNKSQETWMDSISREGFRIEIQCLRIAVYDLLHNATKAKVYGDLRDKLAKITKKRFLENNCLKDGIQDSTIRPNVFIAAYIYPKLLSVQEWIKCFDTMLPKLWLEWGGLSTIDTENQEFHKYSTGQNAESYHNGDSWYWINNLAAIVLCRTDRKRYKEYISKIYNASRDEILFKGFIGCHSELSSAAMHESNGCLSQAWSSAMFVELCRELEN